MSQTLEWVEVVPGVLRMKGRIDPVAAERILAEQKRITASQPSGPSTEVPETTARFRSAGESKGRQKSNTLVGHRRKKRTARG